MTPLFPADLSGVAPILAVGVEEMPVSQLTELVESVTRAQDELVNAAFRAALASGRVTPVCPDTPDELFNPDTLTLRLRRTPSP